MKKGIIIAILFCSIIMCSRVKAMSLDGIYYGQRKVNDSQYTWYFLNSSSTNNLNHSFAFSTPFNSGEADYMQINLISWLDYESVSIIAQSDTSYNGRIYTHDMELFLPRIQLMSNGAWQTCELQNNLIVCPTFHNVTYTGLYIETYSPTWGTTQQFTWRLVLNNYINLYTTATNSIIQNQNNNTQQILESNTTYDQNATQDFTNETQEVENYTQTEQDLMNDLDFNTTDMNITINPNASQFIWNIVDGLRSINGAIVLLMTSLLSIGVIKLVLGR